MPKSRKFVQTKLGLSRRAALISSVVVGVVLAGLIYRSFAATTPVNGLTAVYFDNADLTGASVTRIDPNINFNWGTAAPTSGVAAGTYGVRWTGQIKAPTTGRYKISTTSDDGVRVWIGTELVVNSWTNHGPMENSGSLNLTAGVALPIKVEYFNSAGAAQLTLGWQAPGSTTVVAIPTTALATTVATTATPTPTPTPAPPAAGEVRAMAYTTAYDYYDNTPPGAAVISDPVLHSVAGGTGTYADPITLAVGHSIISGKDILDYPKGTKFYIPNVRRYFIVEDTCGDGNTPQNGPCHTGYPTGTSVWVDMWIDGRSGTATAASNCMDKVTDSNGVAHLLIKNPASNYAVVPGPIFQNGACTAVYGNTVVTQ